MRIITPIVTILAAAMLLLFAYSLQPGSFFGDAALIGVPMWAICSLLALALLVVTGDQLRRTRQS